MRFANKDLEPLPRTPYFFGEDTQNWEINRCLEKFLLVEGAKENVKKWKSEREKTIERNSKKVFDKDFMENYQKIIEQKIKRKYFPSEEALLTIFREFGFDLSKALYQDSPIKTLQIGCGPDIDCDIGGNWIDRILTNFGAETINMDIRNVSNFYQKGKFKRGSWLDIEKYFEEKEFNAIFIEDMDPEIEGQIKRHYKTQRLNFAYQDLLSKTMSRLTRNPKSLFFVVKGDGTCFKIPQHVNDDVGLNSTSHTVLWPPKTKGEIQIYKRGGLY